MNTYLRASQLVPLVRYYSCYARTIGKYILNQANSARLFYPKYLQPDCQNNWNWSKKYDKDCCLDYEGVRKEGRRTVKTNADYRTIVGRIVSGDYKATRAKPRLTGPDRFLPVSTGEFVWIATETRLPDRWQFDEDPQPLTQTVGVSSTKRGYRKTG